MRAKRKVLVASGLLTVVTVTFLLQSFSGHHVMVGPVDSRLERQMQELQEKLHRAENVNRQREDEIYALMFKYGDRANLSTGSNGSSLLRDNAGLQLPGIYSYLPQLTGHPEFLRPSVRLSRGRSGVSVIIGVPTIKRTKESYLVKSLFSLLSGLSPEESADCLVVVLIAEPWDKKFVEQVISSIRDNFSPFLESGVLEVIVPPAGFYPNLDNLKETFGDTKERVKWRTKQNLDYTFLMLYGRPRATYYVQLEDDVVAKPGYLSVMKTFVHEQKDDWIMLEFSALGFIGKLFKSSDVSTVVEFFLMFHADKPIDWLMDHLLWVKVCSPEKDVKHCQRMIQGVRRRYKPSLFQHIGVESSLKGKVQKLKDRDFGKAGLYRAHANPPVELSSTLKTYQNFLLSKAYAGETFFWASNPSKGDIIDFLFNPPINIDMFLFRSGNMDHPGDVFHNTTIEVQPVVRVSPETVESIVSKAGLYPTERLNASEGFIPIGHFNEAGFVQGEVPDGLGLIRILRIHVHEKSDAWVILSEIMIKENKR